MMTIAKNIVPPLDLKNADSNQAPTPEANTDSINLDYYCKQLKDENKILSQKLKMSEQEVQLQKQSLSNLALTVVQQNKQMKMLAQQIFNMTKAALAAQECCSSEEGTVSQENSYFAEFINNPANIIAIKEDMSSPDDVLNGLDAVSPFTQSCASGARKSGSSTPYSHKSSGSGQSVLYPQNCRIASPLGGFIPKHFRRSSTLNSVNVAVPVQDHPIMLNRCKSEHVRSKSRSKTPVRFNLDEFFEEDDLKKFQQCTEQLESNTPTSNQFNRNGGVTFRERGEKVYRNGTENENGILQHLENGLITSRRRHQVDNSQDFQFYQNENISEYPRDNNFSRQQLNRSKTAHFEEQKYGHKSCRKMNRSKTAHFEDCESLYEQEYVQSRRAVTPHHNTNLNLKLDVNRINKQRLQYENEADDYKVQTSRQLNHSKIAQISERERDDYFYSGVVTSRRNMKRCQSTMFDERRSEDYIQNGMVTCRKNQNRSKTPHFEERKSNDSLKNRQVTNLRSMSRARTFQGHLEFVDEAQFEHQREMTKSRQGLDRYQTDAYQLDEMYHSIQEAQYEQKAFKNAVSTPRRRIKRSITAPLNNRYLGLSLDQCQGANDMQQQQGYRNSRQHCKNTVYHRYAEEEDGIDIALLNDKIAALEQIQEGELEIITDVANN
eukprot:TRINITY_DN2941_c2_g2_i2.p1 TRINITY_DN2941_c2_g2~~TRINITY_DN2941_c2_g2_i2.p1  ORF type:complete len:663 (-),score=77.08 TRINITY_DN2941_c2_g2_i2:262-2250(-)